MSARLSVASLIEYDPLLDKSYQHTKLGRAVVDFLAWKKLSGAAAATLDQYERDLSRACLMFPEKGLKEFGDDDMIQVATTFRDKERRTRVAAYRSFFKWALRNRKIKLNPCDALPQIKPQPRKVFDTFSSAEITSLVTLPLRDGVLFQLMFDSGARKGDCRNVRLRDWKPDATPDAPYGMLVFREGKGGKDRLVPATDAIARKLSELATLDGLEPMDYLWYTRPGGGRFFRRQAPIGPNAFHDWWTRCLTEAEVRYRNPHMTRHTFATRFLQSRGRLETLQLILGHESIQTTADEYGHLDMRDVAADMGLIESHR